jgi:hypothetical protein
MGGSLKQVNPQAAHAFALHGADSHRLDLPPAPAFASGEAAAEMAELYWHSVLRDTPFAEYFESALFIEACRDLTQFSDFEGPRQAGEVIPTTLFRDLRQAISSGRTCRNSCTRPSRTECSHSINDLARRFLASTI